MKNLIDFINEEKTSTIDSVMFDKYIAENFEKESKFTFEDDLPLVKTKALKSSFKITVYLYDIVLERRDKYVFKLAKSGYGEFGSYDEDPQGWRITRNNIIQREVPFKLLEMFEDFCNANDYELPKTVTFMIEKADYEKSITSKLNKPNINIEELVEKLPNYEGDCDSIRVSKFGTKFDDYANHVLRVDVVGYFDDATPQNYTKAYTSPHEVDYIYFTYKERLGEYYTDNIVLKNGYGNNFKDAERKHQTAVAAAEGVAKILGKNSPKRLCVVSGAMW